MTTMQDLGTLSNATRAARSEWRQKLASGEVPLADCLRERPEVLADVPALRIVEMARRWGVGRTARLNELALRRGVNLALPLRDLSNEHLDWLCEAVEVGIRDFRKATPDIMAELRREINALEEENARLQDESRVLALTQAIRQHKQAIRSVTLDADVAEADEALWEAVT